jgi:hypothetical protein
MLDRLDEIGIDFSVPEAEIREWLDNSEYSPYRAISEALLARLEGLPLRRPVFLDVIVSNYEHSRGNPSPRKVQDVNSRLLEMAVVAGSNQRYGDRNLSGLNRQRAHCLGSAPSEGGDDRSRASVFVEAHTS